MDSNFKSDTFLLLPLAKTKLANFLNLDIVKLDIFGLLIDTGCEIIVFSEHSILICSKHSRPLSILESISEFISFQLEMCKFFKCLNFLTNKLILSELSTFKNLTTSVD